MVGQQLNQSHQLLGSWKGQLLTQKRTHNPLVPSSTLGGHQITKNHNAPLTPAEVWAEMDRREAMLGLAEKLPKTDDIAG